jgi:transglutaminase-like putative cysteine protease
MKWLRNRPHTQTRTPKPVAEPLDSSRIAWLMAVAACALLPHGSHLPGWLLAVAALLFTWRMAQWRLGWPGAGGTVKLLVIIACCAGVTLTFGRLFGREPGVALLTLMLVLKLHELRSTRDGHTVVLLGYFMLLTAFLYSQTPLMAAALAVSMTVITAALIALTGPPARPRALLRQSAWMLAQALPFMLVLFVLFPRVPGPLWGLPLDAYSGVSGLSDSMSPGSISQLSLSGEIAFRARFDGAAPPARDLYWRGPVLTEFDGRTWRQGEAARRIGSTLPHPVPGAALGYEVTLEPHSKSWLFALETVSALPPGTRATDDWQVLGSDVVRNRRRDRFESVPGARPGVEEWSAYLDAARQLPPGGNPRARELARTLRASGSGAATVDATVDAALRLFRREAFVYTLTPPALGADGIDQFLFDTRRGFCEHYAGAFVFLMRAAGVPARVVTGYQGGERNSVDDYVVVRQSDAHAWAEVWLKGEGWRRVDPTAAILPSRIERGLADLPAGEPVPFVARVDLGWVRALRHQWEATNNAWNQWVLSYDQQKQRDLLRRLGMPDPDWRTMTVWLASLCALFAIALTLWAMRRSVAADALARSWTAIDRALRPAGLGRDAWEGPLDYAARVGRIRPDLATLLAHACRLYADARYGDSPVAQAARELKACARALRRQRTPPRS